MKLHRYDIEDSENPYTKFSQEITLNEDLDISHPRFIDVQDIYVDGSGFYDSKTKEFIVGLNIECTVTVPCAITLVPVEIDLDTMLSEIFVFDPNDLVEDDSDANLVEDEALDLLPYIWSAIFAAIPLKVVDPELKEYPSGDGWDVLTEADYQKQKENEIDPRLAKLKEFKFNNGGE